MRTNERADVIENDRRTEEAMEERRRVGGGGQGEGDSFRCGSEAIEKDSQNSGERPVEEPRTHPHNHIHTQYSHSHSRTAPDTHRDTHDTHTVTSTHRHHTHSQCTYARTPFRERARTWKNKRQSPRNKRRVGGGERKEKEEERAMKCRATSVAKTMTISREGG